MSRPAYHITQALLAVFSCLLFIQCTHTPDGKGRRLAFSEVNTAKGLKLVAVYAYNESDTESSNSWNNYTVEVRDPLTGNLEFFTRFHNDAYNDAGAVLHCSAQYAFINANEYKAVSLTAPNLILEYKEIRKRIEDENPVLKNNIAETTTFNINYLRVISKQGDAYIISLNTFKAYSCNCPPNNTIEDSLSFWSDFRYPLENISAPNYKQWVLKNESTVISLEYETINNISKNFLFSYPYVKDEAKPENEAMSKFVYNQPVQQDRFVVDQSHKESLYASPFLISSMIGLVNNSVYITHQNELGDSAREVFTKFDLDNKSIAWTVDFNRIAGATSGKIGLTQWSKDSKAIYFDNTSQDGVIHKLDAGTGKLIYTMAP